MTTGEEFQQLFESCGWTQAELARKLNMSRGALNQIIHGKTQPSAQTLKLFKMILASQNPDALRPADHEASLMRDEPSHAYGQKLAELARDDAASGQMVYQLIDHLSQKVPRKKSQVSSRTADVEADKIAHDLLDAALLDLKPKADQPSGEVYRPGNGGSHRPGRPVLPQTAHPKKPKG